MNRSFRNTICTVIGIIAFTKMSGQTIVANISELNSAISSATAGSTIILKDGTWIDTEININKQGISQSPITIKAETAGSVFFEGNSSIHMGGTYILFEGVIFRNASNLIVSSDRIDPVIEFRDNSGNECDHCQAKNIKIDSYNGTESQSTATFKWVLLYGQYNEISYCSFIGKHGIGSIINDNRNSNDPNYTKIHHNYFANRTPVGEFNALNDQDALRIGNSSTSMSDSYTEVYDNYFYNFSGEIEIISNKSGANKYYNNTFRDYQGSLTLRHGNGNQVYSNYFFAENNNTTAGIRVIGEDQLVYNNYIEGIYSKKQDGSSSNVTGGINITNGRPSSALNGYFQVRNSKIINNTFVDCDLAIRVGTKVSSDLTLAPENVIIANNIMMNTSSKAITVTTAPIGSSLYEGNITQNGNWDITTGTNGNISTSATLLTDDGNFHRLTGNSPAVDAGLGTYSFLTEDLLGGTRGASFDAGAEEFGANGTNLPYSNEDVGVNVGFKPASATTTDTSEDDDGLYFSEILFNKDGAESTYQFIELRGVPNQVIADYTYIGVVEGDNESGDAGKIKWWFDISGVTIGSNGYLVIRQKNSPYNIAPGATVITGTHTNTVDLTNNDPNTNPSANGEVAAVFEGFKDLDGGASYAGSNTTVNDGQADQQSVEKGDIESLSQNFLLIQHTEALAHKGVYDANKDGQPDANWIILDQIATLDDDGTELGYGGLIFSQTSSNTLLLQTGATVLTNSFEIGYMARLGVTTGSSSSDWIGAQVEENGAYIKLKNQTNESYSGHIVSIIGGPNFSVTYSEGAGFTPTLPSQFLDLRFNSNFTSNSDIACNKLDISSSTTLTIASGHSLTINGDLNVEGELIIESGAALITNGTKITGDVIIKRNTRYADGKYSFVGSPVVSSESIKGSDLGNRAYYYDESETYSTLGGPRWKDAASVTLSPGHGYAQAFKQELNFEGVPNSGDIIVEGLTYTAGTAGEQGWNLLANPYPAAIDVAKFLNANTANIENAVYLWDDGGSESGTSSNSDYLSVNALGTVGGPNSGSFNGYIGSAQGFFVKLKAEGTASVTFTEDLREIGNNADANFFRISNTEGTRIKLALHSEKSDFYNELLIGLKDDATNQVDEAYDAPKLLSNNDLQFYSFIEYGKYAIQGLPLAEGITTELGFDLGAATTLDLTVKEITGLDDGLSLFITDKVTNKVYDLNKTASFSFFSEAGSSQNRFVLSYGVASVLAGENEFSGPVYRFFNYELMVSFKKKIKVESYSIYDLTGKILIARNELSKEVESFNITIKSTGINVVKIETNQGTFIRKFIF